MVSDYNKPRGIDIMTKLLHSPYDCQRFNFRHAIVLFSGGERTRSEGNSMSTLVGRITLTQYDTSTSRTRAIRIEFQWR